MKCWLYSFLPCIHIAECALPPFMSKAHVILIHKSPKDPKLCASYRPIALLNNDLKILTILLTNRLDPLLPLIIDADQTGFMAHKSTDINLSRLFMNIQANHKKQGSRFIASLDIEKALDTVEWPFLWENEVPPALHYLDKNTILFSNSCHLLGGPSLFAIVMEPVAEALHVSPLIKGLKLAWLKERGALYADDLLMFLNDVGPSLLSVLHVLNAFSEKTWT